MSKPKLILAVPSVEDAVQQYLLAKTMYEEEPDTDTYANMLRAAMVVNTKKIALTEAEVLELRALKQNAKEPA